MVFGLGSNRTTLNFESEKSRTHNWLNYSLGSGIVLDLSFLNSIHINKKNRTVDVGSGVKIGPLVAQLAKDGLAVAVGTSVNMSVGELALGGGIGPLTRMYGLTCDTVTSFDIVLADQTLLTVGDVNFADRFLKQIQRHQDGKRRKNKNNKNNKNKNKNKQRKDEKETPSTTLENVSDDATTTTNLIQSQNELFWATLGSGAGNFGVVSRLTLKLFRIPRVTMFVLWLPFSFVNQVVKLWQRMAPQADPRFSISLRPLYTNDNDCKETNRSIWPMSRSRTRSNRFGKSILSLV